MCVCVYACVCVCVSVRKSVSTIFLDNRGSSELQTWICFEVGCLDGKLRLERRSPGKRVKRAGSQGECALIRVRGLWRGALFCAPSKQDRRLAVLPGLRKNPFSTDFRYSVEATEGIRTEKCHLRISRIARSIRMRTIYFEFFRV